MSAEKKTTPPAGTAGTSGPSTEAPYLGADTLPFPDHKPAPEDSTSEEAKAREGMNPSLEAKVIQMRSLMRDERSIMLDSRYELGSLVLEVKKDPQTYGAVSDIQLAEFFGDSGKTVCNEARRIRERYSPEEYEKIKNAVNPSNGARISYKHLTVLLRIEKAELAGKMLCDCLKSGWSTKELARQVSKKLKELCEQKPSRSRRA
jgi:hypothetical protein